MRSGGNAHSGLAARPHVPFGSLRYRTPWQVRMRPRCSGPNARRPTTGTCSFVTNLMRPGTPAARSRRDRRRPGLAIRTWPSRRAGRRGVASASRTSPSCVPEWWSPCRSSSSSRGRWPPSSSFFQSRRTPRRRSRCRRSGHSPGFRELRAAPRHQSARASSPMRPRQRSTWPESLSSSDLVASSVLACRSPS